MPIQQIVSKIKGVADILFLIDSSDSMAPCIAGIKNNLTSFVNYMENTDPNLMVDWQIGFCSHNTEYNIHLLSSDVTEFLNELSKVKTMGDEFTPGALDYSITSFNWRNNSTKYIVLFTDETLEGGILIQMAKNNFSKLFRKLIESRIYLFYFGPQCPYYCQFEQIPNSRVEYIANDFTNIDFKEILQSIGRTVSASCTSQISSINPSNLELVYPVYYGRSLRPKHEINVKKI